MIFFFLNDWKEINVLVRKNIITNSSIKYQVFPSISYEKR